MIDLTLDEIKLIRKCLQCASFAHTVIETAEGTSDRDTPIDALIRKFRAFEESENENRSNCKWCGAKMEGAETEIKNYLETIVGSKGGITQ